MISLKQALFVLLAAVLVAAVAAATPPQASAGFSTSPRVPGTGDGVDGHRFGPTESVTDGTSNTIVTLRKAGGGPREHIVILPPPHAPPFVPVPLPVFSTR
jgi:hypothetical protein